MQNSPHSFNFYEMLYLFLQRAGHIYSVFANILKCSSKTIKRNIQKIKIKFPGNFNFDYWIQHHIIKDSDWIQFINQSNFINWKHILSLPQFKDFPFDKLVIPDEFKTLNPHYLKFAMGLLSAKQGITPHGAYPLFESTYQFLIKQIFIFSDITYYLHNKNYEQYLICADKLQFPFPLPKEEIYSYFFSQQDTPATEKYFSDLVLFIALLFDMVFLTDELAQENKRGKSLLTLYFPTLIEHPEFSYKKEFYEERKKFVLKQCEKTKFTDKELYKIIRTQENADTEDENNKKLCNDIKFEEFPRPERLLDFLNTIYKNLPIDEKTKETQIRNDLATYALYYLLEEIRTRLVPMYGTLENVQNQLVSYQNWICANIFKCSPPA